MAYGGVASLLQTLDYLIDLFILFSDICKIRVHHVLTAMEEERTRADTTDLIRFFSRKLLRNFLPGRKFGSYCLQFMVSSKPLLARETEYRFLLGIGQMGLDDLSILCSLLHHSKKQPFTEGECSSSTATMELHDIEILSSKTLKQCFRDWAREFMFEYREFNDVILLYCDVYKDLIFLHGDVQFLLAFLGDSWDIDEDQLKFVKEVSERAKHVIEESILKSHIEVALEMMSVELMNGVQVDPVGRMRNLLEAISIIDIQCTRKCLVRAREEINCIKAGILETTFKHGCINIQVPKPKLQQKHLKREIMVGFGDEELFLEELIYNPTQPGLQILTIVGMGGIGKTTLAKLLFNHPYVVYHFDCLAWITVSQGYDKRNLLLRLLNSFSYKSDKVSEKSNAELAESVYRSLKCKRYLIVMDDMWETKSWNDVKRCFPDGKTGSRILITSRLANYVSPNKTPHFMNLFDAEKSWELLQKLVCKNAVCSPQLEEVGRKIAKRCRGLPLATPMTLVSWSQIAENLNSIVVKHPEQCLDILALSIESLFSVYGSFPRGL